MEYDAEQTLEMVERLRDFEPYLWLKSVSLNSLEKMGQACLDQSVSKEIREERFQQYLGAKVMATLLETLEQGLRLGIAQKKKNGK
jgi:hypothetical protein